MKCYTCADSEVGMESVTVETLTQFTELIERVCTDQSTVLFRGQPEDWPLLPSIARERLIDELLASERAMLDEFQRHGHPFLRAAPATTWEWVALAQHYGLPTRLLDWSLNPLTSLWFAVSRPPVGSKDGVVWILRPDDDDFATADDERHLQCKRHLVFAPRDVSERITAQVAWFTVHKAWAEDPSFEPLESSAQFASKLTKVIIPAGRFAHLRFYLDRYGINHGSVFP